MNSDKHAKFQPETYYHIYNRGNNGETIFLSDDNFNFFLSRWQKYIQPFVNVLSYCLMPNHFHFLIKVKSEEQIKLNKSLTKPLRLGKAESCDVNSILEKQFQKFFMSYVHAFNRQQNRTGSLFQKRFKRIEISSNEYLTKIIHYIHHNPIHHGFVGSYEKWKYSSYRVFVNQNSSQVDRYSVLKWFGDKNEFLKFHKLNQSNPNFHNLHSVLVKEEESHYAKNPSQDINR